VLELDGMRLYQGRPEAVTVPSERVEYFTPGRWTLSSLNLDQFADFLQSEPQDLRKGSTTDLAWNKAAYGPAFTGEALDELDVHPWAWRLGSLIDITVPLFGDSAGHPRLPTTEEGTDTGKSSLYQDGKLLGTVNVPGRGIFPAPNDEHAYRFTTTVTRNAPWWPLATTVKGTWTFKSAVWGEPALPLLTVGLDPAVDLRNTAPGGGSFSFPATVRRQAGSGEDAAITSLAVKVSYDDGATWKAATVTRDGDHWKVTVTHPASGYVSLRAQAADAAGNTVDQTVIRAYQLR
jgi:hypothetical protein